mgnify:CR=1 FL=1
MKPGYKTTEFWLTLVVTVTGVIGSIADPTVFGKWGPALVAIANVGYLISRSYVKGKTNL